MRVVGARNVNQAIVDGLRVLHSFGHKRDSRNGPVQVIDGPMTTVYAMPKERVVFWPQRDANPFFHFMEGLWMISGRNDVKWISWFSSNISNYSDDGKTFHGAYGHRWRYHFQDLDYAETIDQLTVIADLLKKNRDDRRIVLQMWDPVTDLGMDGKDFPCNICIMFRVSVTGALDMTVINRSNDAIWGAYGANAVHMSMLQEVMAAWIGVHVGHYWQISNNFHAYLNIFEKHSSLLYVDPLKDPYEQEEVSPYPMVNGPIEDWFSDLNMFMSEGPVLGFKDKFFKKVVSPIWKAWEALKENDHQLALVHLRSCEASDWRRACEEWIIRRIK